MAEDEADAIMAMRIEKEEAGSAIPIRQYMRLRTSSGRTQDKLLSQIQQAFEDPIMDAAWRSLSTPTPAGVH